MMTHEIHPALICIPPPANKLNVSFMFVLKGSLCLPHQGACLNIEFTGGKLFWRSKTVFLGIKVLEKYVPLSLSLLIVHMESIGLCEMLC